MSIKLVVFDIAGTTVRDDHEVSKAFRAALLKSKYDVPIELIDPLMGYEKTQAIKHILRLHEHNEAKITTDLVSKIHVEFVYEMIRHYREAKGVEPLPHVEETFEKLHAQGIKIGINTGFSRDIADTIVERLKWKERGLIDFVIGSDEVEAGRPYPFMIKKMMQDAGIADAKKVVKVGDTEVDVREGQNAGCRYSIGVTTGAFSRTQLEPYHPDYIIDDIAGVIDIINQ